MQVVLQEMAAAENDLLETRTTPRGLLRVDAATPVMLHFLMPLVKPFRERYPEMTLSLVSSETFINLIERKVDVAIRAGTLTDSSLRARPLFTSYRKIVASPDYVARYGMPQHPSDLKTASLPRLHRAGIAEYLAGLLLRWPAVRDRSGGVIQ
ncbi:LysR family transcriptional regulator [Klebsiella pneumoniae]|nr:LysR family transcriptional regulator [Klebsiella pneumoniae]